MASYRGLQQTISLVLRNYVPVKYLTLWILIFGSFCLMWMTVSVLDNTPDKRGRPQTHESLRTYWDSATKVRPPNSSYDLMIFSYMRSGSTMTGELFSENRDFFFVFEPLLSLVPYQYLTTTDVCTMRNLVCSSEDFDDKLQYAMDLIYNIYDCNLREIQPNTLEYIVQENKSGPSWSEFTDCANAALRGLNLTIKSVVAKRNNDIQLSEVQLIDHCFVKLENACRRSRAKVTKVLRLSMRLIPRLMSQLPRLKILLLVRDPRAIIYSRLKTDWFPVCEKDPYGVFENTRSLCKKMNDDILVLNHLKNKYPDRLLIHRLEDVAVDSPEMFKGTLDFLNVKGVAIETQKIIKKYVNKLHEGFTVQWKKMMKDQFKKMVDENCQKVIQYYKYVQ